MFDDNYIYTRAFPTDGIRDQEEEIGPHVELQWTLTTSNYFEYAIKCRGGTLRSIVMSTI